MTRHQWLEATRWLLARHPTEFQFWADSMPRDGTRATVESMGSVLRGGIEEQMRRAITAAFVTAIGVGLLVAYKPNPGRLATTTSPSPPPSTAPPAGNGATSTPAPSAAATPAPATVPGGSFTGSDISTPYGDVQVKAVVSGGRLTKVQALQLPNDRSRSVEISQYAEPILRQEAIQAQSANIDAVSGATYTSEAYSQSLANALQKAHLG